MTNNRIKNQINKNTKHDIYDTVLINQLIDENKWPDFPDLIVDLAKIAHEAFIKDTIEGYLAAVLIYQQIIEESVRILIRLSTLYLRGQIWPSVIDFKVNDEEISFGQLLGELKRGVKFDMRKEFINKCNELNSIRIKFVHKLTKMNLNEIKVKAQSVKKLFNEILDLFEIGSSYYLRLLEDLNHSIDWKDMI